MFAAIQAFLADWKRESDGTAKLFDALTDASLAQRVSDEDRTLGRIAWHIVLTIPEMMGHTGLSVEGPAEDTPVPATASALAAAYKRAAAALAARLASEWVDDTLRVEDDLYGERWPRGVTLDVLIRHEIHHRGQMTVLMRQAGLAVPGIYGPSREEWARHGMNAPEI